MGAHGESTPALAKEERTLKAGPGATDLEFSTLQGAGGGDFRRILVLTIEVGGLLRTLRTPPFGGD